MLRGLIKSGLLKFKDLEDNPDRFFEAHRLLLAPKARGPGFGIRFTVQYNLFAGSILGLGGPEQVANLDEFQRDGTLGCFCLTEKYAGVNSGLVVNTIAEWNAEKQMFRLDSPNEAAEKNWISQGLTATKAVVIADLMIEGKRYGPHGFLVDIRDEVGGEPLIGITLTDMGLKTTANDLDNAAIRFKNVWVPKSGLLNRFADIDENNQYVQTTAERMRLEVIGQRLLTGRLAIAQGGIMFGKALYGQTKRFSDSRKVWTPKGAPEASLSSLPHLNSLYQEAELTFDRLLSFSRSVEARLSAHMKNGTIPEPDLVEAIAVCKIKCIETSILLCFRLQQEVGSYGLMGGTGFEHLSFLQCCKFAEGDSRILSQKLARDAMKSFQKSTWVDSGKEFLFGSSAEQREINTCFQLAAALKSSNKTPLEAWNDNWKLVYQLADAVCEKHIIKTLGPPSPELAAFPSAKL